jgi:hypothetical protein
MLKYVLFGSIAVLICAAVQAQAVSLPSNDVDRAIACSVYGGFAPEADPRTAPAKREIDQTVREAVASGERTQRQVTDAFYDTAMLAMKGEPREELIANWNECRDSFGAGDDRDDDRS